MSITVNLSDHPDARRNWSSAMQRIKAYARSASEAASNGDFDAALVALNLIERLCDEAAAAIKSEVNRRAGLEVRNA